MSGFNFDAAPREGHMFVIKPILDGRRWVVRIDGRTLMNKAPEGPRRGPVRFGSKHGAVAGAVRRLTEAGLLPTQRRPGDNGLADPSAGVAPVATGLVIDIRDQHNKGGAS